METQSPHPLQRIAMDSFVGLLPSAEDDVGAEASSPLAIHVYSTLAKLHKHSLIPYLPRIIASVLSSLSCSPQLHSACTQVVAALAVHTIDSSCDPASNEDTLRNLCHPLLSELSSSDPPHLAAGVASCLQTLVESDRWRCAPLDLQELVCMKGTDALMNEGTQTIPHMDLMRSLAKLSSSVVIQGYGASLLGAGMDILHNSCDTAKRVAAAQLLQSVLKIVDAELLDLDLSPIMGVLQECQQDREAGVRSAAADALKTASMYVTCDATSHRVHKRTSHQNMQQSPLGLQTMSHMASPASGYEVLPDMALPNGGMPCCGTECTSIPSSDKSSKWLKRLPLAPLQQLSLANPPRRRPATFKCSEYKENIAPTHKARLPRSSRDGSRRTWMPKRESPMLWSKDVKKKAYTESVGLFDSPQTPIVPYCEGDEAKDGTSSVSFLLEKHFGKQRDCFEDQFPVSLRNSNVNMTCSDRYEIFYEGKEKCNSFEKDTGRVEQYGDSEVCNSFDSDARERRSIDSTGTNICCGTEGLCTPSQESVGECESGATSEQDSNFQVAKHLEMDGTLLMSPKRLICSLQSDDEYQSNLDQENIAHFDALFGTYDSDEFEEDDYDGDLKTDTISEEESVASSPCILSENYNLHCEWDMQLSTAKRDSGVRKKGVVCGDFPEMQEAGTSVESTLKYRGGSCLEEERTMQCPKNQVNYVHTPASGAVLSSLDITDHRINTELKTSNPSQKTEHIVCSRSWRKVQGLVLLAVAVGMFCVGIMTYMGNLEASNMLVPT